MPGNMLRQAVSELAPGSPWKEIRLVFSGAMIGPYRFDKYCSRPLEIVGRVDAERHRLHDLGVDAHAGFERAQLFEPLAPFQRRRRQRHEALERGAAVGIEPDVVIERPVAPGRGRASEIERPQPRRRQRRADDLDDVRVRLALPRARFRRRASRCRRHCPRAAASTARIVAGSMVGRSPWTLTTMSTSPLGIERLQRLDGYGRSRTRGRRASSPPRNPRRGRLRRPLRRRSPRRRGRARSRAPSPRHGRSSAGRQCRPAACPEAVSRPCGPGSGRGWTSKRAGRKKDESKVAKRLMDAALIGVATTKQKT